MSPAEHMVAMAIVSLHSYEYLEDPVHAKNVRMLLLSLFERLDKADDRIRELERKLGVDQ